MLKVLAVIKPRRMHRRGNYGTQSVCMYVCVCVCVCVCVLQVYMELKHLYN